MQSSKPIIISLIIGGLVVGGAMLYSRRSTPNDNSSTQSANVLDAAKTVIGSEKEFTVTSRQFSFEPSIIRVKKGDTVKIRATSTDITHGIAVPAFNFNVLAPVGSYASGEFVADKIGTYDFFCSVFCGSGHAAMRGQLIVE